MYVNFAKGSWYLANEVLNSERMVNFWGYKLGVLPNNYSSMLLSSKFNKFGANDVRSLFYGREYFFPTDEG